MRPCTPGGTTCTATALTARVYCGSQEQNSNVYESWMRERDPKDQVSKLSLVLELSK